MSGKRFLRRKFGDMPKKMGENSKAVEARERKQAEKKATAAKAAKEAEDKLWADDDKNLAKKKQKKEEEERKKQQLLAKKEENKKLLDAEMNSITTTGKVSIQKITRAQINEETERRNRNIELINKANNKPAAVAVVKDDPLVENLNRVVLDSQVAATVDEAITVLNDCQITDDDKHPEKRMKAAYRVYEEAQLPRIKSENPSLKLSQLKQILFKDWQRSPENPLNKA